MSGEREREGSISSDSSNSDEFEEYEKSSECSKSVSDSDKENGGVDDDIENTSITSDDYVDSRDIANFDEYR